MSFEQILEDYCRQQKMDSLGSWHRGPCAHVSQLLAMVTKLRTKLNQ